MKIRIIIAISLIYSGILYGQYFLKEYKDIRLGMSRKELQATRPNTEPFGFEEKNSDLLVEKVSVDEIKGTVMYGFDEDTLVSFMMGTEFKNLEDATDLLKGIFSNYSGYEILSVKPVGDGIIKFNTNKTYDSFLSIALLKDKRNHNKSVISYQVVDDEFSKRINLEEAFKSNGYDKAAFESFKARVAAFAEKTFAEDPEETVSLVKPPLQVTSNKQAQIEKPAPPDRPSSNLQEHATEKSSNLWLWLGLLCLFLLLIAILLRITRR